MIGGVLIDSNVLIDATLPTSRFQTWAKEQVLAIVDAGAARINPLIYAEVAATFGSDEELEEALSPHLYRREPLPWEAALPASRAFLRYPRGGGTRTSPLPDFYIGAHAEVAGHKLLTRDVARFRTYFPSVELIRPN